MSGWRQEPFDAVIADESGGNVKTPQSEFLPTGRYPIVDQGKELIAGYTDDESRLCRAALPVIVFGDHTRCFKYIDFPFCMGADGVKVLRPKIAADVKYLYHYLRQLRLTEGGYDRHFKYLKRSSITLPPLPEQRRIAEILDKADALRAKRRAALAQLDTLTQSIFLAMFGDPATNPKGWPVTRLENEITSVRYGTGSPPPYVEEGVPFIRATNIKAGTILPTDLKCISFDEATRIDKCRVQAGNLIIVRSGVNTGDCAIVPSEYDGACAAFDLIVELPWANAVFYNFLINSQHGKKHLEPLTRRAAQPHLNAEQVRSLRFISPDSRSKARFAEIIGAINHVKAECGVNLDELGALFGSLQHRAFQGDL